MSRALAIGLTLALVLGARAGAQDAPFLEVERAAITTPDAGVAQVDGGAWLSDAALDRAYARRAQLEAENTYLRAHAGDVEARWVLAGTAAGLVLGAAVVFFFHR